MQSWHLPLTGEKCWARSTSFQEIECSIFRFLRSQIWLLSEVWLASGSLNEFLCVPSLALNVVDVNPIYVSVPPFVCFTNNNIYSERLKVKNVLFEQKTIWFESLQTCLNLSCTIVLLIEQSYISNTKQRLIIKLPTDCVFTTLGLKTQNIIVYSERNSRDIKWSPRICSHIQIMTVLKRHKVL